MGDTKLTKRIEPNYSSEIVYDINFKGSDIGFVTCRIEGVKLIVMLISITQKVTISLEFPKELYKELSKAALAEDCERLMMETKDGEQFGMYKYLTS